MSSLASLVEECDFDVRAFLGFVARVSPIVSQIEINENVVAALVAEAVDAVKEQYKGPLGFLEMSPEKAFISRWWAIVEAFVTASQP